MKIKVIIEEHISKEMEIEADSMEEAMEKAEDYYYNGEFAVDTLGIPSCTLMMADDGQYQTDWVEF
jgi:hypothetical protein